MSLSIQNEGRQVKLEANENLRDACLRTGIALYKGARKALNCRGMGHCGSCEVLVVEGAYDLTERTPAEHKKLKTYDPCRRLACQAAVIGEADITINTLAD